MPEAVSPSSRSGKLNANLCVIEPVYSLAVAVSGRLCSPSGLWVGLPSLVLICTTTFTMLNSVKSYVFFCRVKIRKGCRSLYGKEGKTLKKGK